MIRVWRVGGVEHGHDCGESEVGAGDARRTARPRSVTVAVSSREFIPGEGRSVVLIKPCRSSSARSRASVPSCSADYGQIEPAWRFSDACEQGE